MPANRISDIMGKPVPSFASADDRKAGWWNAVGNAYMLDTSIGQGVMMSSVASAFGVHGAANYRRVQEGYNPYDKEQEDLTGYGHFLHEFKHSTSPEETMLIKQMIENNLDLRQDLEGWGGTRLFAGLLDPINLVPVPFALGKGFIEGARIALKRGVPIVAGTEIARHAIDPTSTAQETAMNVLGGSLFMGVIGGAVGKIPKDTMRVSTALNKFIPPQGQTGMSLGVPWHAGGSPSNAWSRVSRMIKSAVNYGDPAWKQVDPETVHLKRIEALDETDAAATIIEIRVDGIDAPVLQAAIRGGDTLQIFDVRVPKANQRKGLASFAIRRAVKYAEDNGMKVTSDIQVSKDALGLWKYFEERGYKVKENTSYEVDSKGTRDSTNGQPLFELVRQIDPEEIRIPKESREWIADVEGKAQKAEMEYRVLKAAQDELAAKVKNAPKAGGAKTKATKEFKEMVELVVKAEQDWKRAKSNADNTNARVAELLDADTIKDWDLLPVGYGGILGKLDQFPWWKLIKTPLRKDYPELAVQYQMWALKIASTPGLNNKGNKLKSSTGMNVESATLIYTGKWLGATRTAQTIYRKYIGHGESSSQVKHFVVDQTQRVRGTLEKLKGNEKPTTTPDGKLTVEQFDTEISIAIANGRHEVPEVMAAAAEFQRVLKEMGEEGIQLGIFATQANITRRIDYIDGQLDNFRNRWSDKFDTSEAKAPKERDTTPEIDELEAERAKLQEELDYVTQVRSEYVDSTPIFVPDHVTKLEDGINDVYINDAIRPGRNLADATGVDTPTRVEVLKNPTRRELARWAGRDVDTVRFAVDDNGSLYVWNANEMLHETFRNSTNVGAMKNAFFDVAVEPKRLFDEFINARQTGEFDGSPLRKSKLERGENESLTDFVVRQEEELRTGGRDETDIRDVFTMPRRVLDEIELETKARMAKLDKEAPAPAAEAPAPTVNPRRAEIEAESLGIADPEGYVALTRTVVAAEKNGDTRHVDPETGRNMNAAELMDQLADEGKPTMGREFSRRRGYTETEIEDFMSWHDQTKEMMMSGGVDRTDDFAGLTAMIQDEVAASLNAKKPLPPALQGHLDNLLTERMEMEDLKASYKDAENTAFVHRMWDAETVVEKRAELEEMLRVSFEADPKYVVRNPDGTIKPENPEVLRGRVNEAYASILHDAENGNRGNTIGLSNTRKWLNSRKNEIEMGTYQDSMGPLSGKAAATMLKTIQKKLDRISNKEILKLEEELRLLQDNYAEFGGRATKKAIKKVEDQIAKIDDSHVGGANGPLVARRLTLDDSVLIKSGLIEGNVNNWMQHYVSRVAPVIETARMFGDGRATKSITELHDKTFAMALKETDPKKKELLFKEARRNMQAMNDLRDIVQGNYGIPDNPDAITPRLLRILRNFNILGAMGRSVMMALGDIGNVVVSQGFARSLGHGFEHFASGITDGNIAMMRQEVDLAGSVSEVILGMRYHQMTDFGIATGSTKYPKMAKFEKGLANMSQRFFLYNLLGPWTDMARRFSGGMLQSRLIENSLAWKAGTLSDDEITIMGRLGINEKRAIQFANEWEESGSLKHGHMYIANTTEWLSDEGVRVFRSAMNTEINRMVPTPGAVDKPKALLKGEWWKVIGQYRGFSIAATHRIMGAGIHTKGATKYSGIASMVGIAFMVDALKRPDYIQLPLEEQILRAIELSGVTGVILDLNDTIERMTAGSVGVRPMLGMDIRERNPNWANRLGTIGAVPNQWLTLMYGLTSDEAETDDLARAIRYMIPYNNLLWWNEAFTRVQRASVDFIEDTEE